MTCTVCCVIWSELTLKRLYRLIKIILEQRGGLSEVVWKLLYNWFRYLCRVESPVLCAKVFSIEWNWIHYTATPSLILKFLKNGLAQSFKKRCLNSTSNDPSFFDTVDLHLSGALSALAYGKEILAVIVFHQQKFLEKKPFNFRACCDDLGWELSVAFCEYFYHILFVICADVTLIKSGESGVQKKVEQVLKKAAKAAKKDNKISYKEAFKLLQIIFPSALKWFLSICRVFQSYR